MSLQRRLTLIFILIVIPLLAAAGFALQRVVVGEITRRAEMSLGPALDATIIVYDDRSRSIDEQIAAAVASPRFLNLVEQRDRARLEAHLLRSLDRGDTLDFFVVLDNARRVIASASTPGSFLPAVVRPGPKEIVAAETGGSGFSRTELPVEVAGRGAIGSVVGGFWVDRDLLMAARDEVDLSVVGDGRLVATTAPIDVPLPLQPRFDGSFDADIGGEATAQARELTDGMSVVASTGSGDITALSRKLQLTLVGLLLLALIGTAILAYVLARLITQPLEELAEGANAIAEGHFEHRIPVKSSDEVARLAIAFNDMTDHLRDTIGQLSSSRDQLQRTVRRIGETLRSTHDMKQMLHSILNTAADAVQAEAAILWTFTATRDEVYASLVQGYDTTKLGRVARGEGVVGLVAESAARISIPSPGGGPSPARGEPDLPVAIAVPVYSQDRIRAVLAVYRKDVSRAFHRSDLDTVMFLAEQGGVAIENVILHEEAQRLSLTDGLTGVWNRRFFQMQFRQVLATAQRFERPFSILMMDLDRFKLVNDTFGHPRGDAILVEFAQRVNKVLREVDTFARYGGEEFICLLSETDLYGAATTAEKIIDALRSEPFGHLGEDAIALTVSIGVASYPEHGDTFKALVQAADQALYSAKQQGRDRMVLAEKPTPTGLKIAK